MNNKLLKWVVMLVAMAMLINLQGVTAQNDDWNIELEDILSDFVFADEPGMVVFVGDSEESAIAAVGLSNLDDGTRIQVDDLFRIGSSSKPFMAVLTLQLVDEGLVELDAPIGDYLPVDIAAQVPNADIATVREVLNMTSGIFSYTESFDFEDAIFDNPQRAWTAEDVIAFTYNETPDFAPGEDWYYSNSNYILAHILVETVTGESLADALDARIFTPLSMSSCYLEDPTNLAAGLMPGYADDGEFVDISRINDGIGLGDGGIICNATDLARFLPALFGGNLLEDETLVQMLDFVDTGDEGGYGPGMSQKFVAAYELWGHEGSTSGFASDMQYAPDAETVVIILTNNFDSDVIEAMLETTLVWWLEE